MKKQAFALVLLLVSIGSRAQIAYSSGHWENRKISWGVRGSFQGATVTKFDLIKDITPKFKLAGSGGAAILAEIPIYKNFSIQPELTFNQKGFLISEGLSSATNFAGINIPLKASVKLKTFYIETPILAKIHFGDISKTHGYFMFGPSVGYLADAGMRIRVLDVFPINTGFPKNAFKDFEFSGITALGFEAPITQKLAFFGEGRYQYGFTRILNTGWLKVPVRNETMSVGLGFKMHM